MSGFASWIRTRGPGSPCLSGAAPMRRRRIGGVPGINRAASTQAFFLIGACCLGKAVERNQGAWPADPWTLPDGTGEVGSWEIAEGPGPSRRAPRETPVAPFAVLQRPIRWELGQEGVAPAKRPTGQLMSRRRMRRVPRTRTAKLVGVITVMGGAGASGGWQGGMSPARRTCRPRVTRPAQGGQALSVGKGGVIRVARAAGGTQPGEETPARGSANDDGVWRRFP